MLKRLLSVGVLLVCVAMPLSYSTTRGEEPQTISLVASQAADGTLDGWGFFCEEETTRCGEVWKLAEGVLVCKGTPKGYIHTRKDYTNFVLRLEWRWPRNKKPGNGGVLIRTAGPQKIWPRSLEAQINATQAGDFWGLDGFSLKGPANRTKELAHDQFGQLTNIKKIADAEKPAGQWNCYEIIAQRDVVTLKINGRVVNKATRCDVAPGKICLTAEGDEIHFRKIELVER